MLETTGLYKVYKLDINDPTNPVDINNLKDYNEQFDTVIHLAALVNVGESVREPTSYYLTNLLGTINVLGQLKFDNFIFASTGAAVGAASPYGISKRAAEDVVTHYCTQQRKEYTIFRFYNVIGSTGFAPTNVDGLFYNLNQAELTGSFQLHGTDYNTKDGTCVRDYVHVNEICYALVTAIEQPANALENLGHGNGWTVKEIVELYKQVNNVDFNIIEMPRRLGDLESSVLTNVSKYMKKNYTIEELVRRY
jgi:UDP-glucose 4-epimerase